MFIYFSKNRKYYLIGAFTITIGAFLHFAAYFAYSQDNDLHNVFLPAVSVDADASLTLTPTPSVEPGGTIPQTTFTSTPTPTGTATSPPATPTATVPPTTPQAGAPLCVEHDPRAYHSLWNSALNCHYDHEHKDNPHAVDDIFGSQIYEWAGGEISYPWQTFAGANEFYPAPPEVGKFENDIKHIGYGWLVRRDLPCAEEPCITDFRIEYHAIMAPIGALTRFHSFYEEIRVRHSSGQYGIIRRSGWIDFGHLEVNAEHVALPIDPEILNTGNRRLHGSGPFATWYATNNSNFAGFAIATADAWAPVDDENALSQTAFYCPDFQCDMNGSTMEPHVVAARTFRYFDNDQYVPIDGSPIDTDSRIGYITASGYTDRYGYVVSGCTIPGLDCVPYAIINMPPEDFLQYRGSIQEYDISPSDQYWIEYHH